MGFFADDEREQMRIQDMILNMVGDACFEPQLARAFEHLPLFMSRNRDGDTAAIHEFR